MLLTDKSDDKGYFSFEDVVFDEYIIHKIESPTGYVLSVEIFEIVIAEDGKIVRTIAAS